MSNAKRRFALDTVDPAWIGTFPYPASILDDHDVAAERIYPPIIAWLKARGLRHEAQIYLLEQQGDEIIGLACSSDPDSRALWTLEAKLTKRNARALKAAFPHVFVSDISKTDWVQVTITSLGERASFTPT